MLEVSLDLDKRPSKSVDTPTKRKDAKNPLNNNNSDQLEDEGGEGGEEEGEEEYGEEEKSNDFIRTKKILRDVAPTLLFSLIQLVQEMIVLFFIGHYGNATEFAAVGKVLN